MRLLLAILLGGLLAAGESPVERIQGQALAFAQAQAAGLPGEFRFKVVKAPALPSGAGEDLRFEPSHLSRKDLAGRFFVSFRATAGTRPLGMVRVDLEGRWTGKLLRSREAMPRKAPLDPAQWEATDFEGIPPAGAVGELPEGCRLRNALPAGHTLVQADLERIPVISPGEQVRLEVSDGSLKVTVDGVARSGGAVGERIRVELPGKGKCLQAIVAGPGEARAAFTGR